MAYWEHLRAEAGRQRLWERAFWQRLLHIQRTLIGGGVESMADGPGFFMSPQGKTDPRAELEATLAAFFSGKLLEPGKMTAQCTFPARYRWLKEQLGFDPARLPAQPCERFDAWRAALDPESVTLIYASYYLNNPASAFGHTLLRFDKRGRPERERLVDYAVNYAAAVPPEDGAIVFAWRGILGGYLGYFSILPYYLKVREYGDLENRDLWEYRLALTPEQLDWMVRHTWEMGSTYFDYYFFGENCAYHLLSLLEAANPDLRLTPHFPVWTLPTDTVRVVAAQPGLVEEVRYRPSRGSRLRQKLAAMSGPEREWAGRLIAGTAAPEDAALDALPPARRALALDAAVDALQYQVADDPDPAAPRKAALRPLLLARSRLGTPYDPDAFPPQSTPPETGHASSRATLGAGGNTSKHNGAGVRFAEAGGYGAFHDLLSRDEGYAAHSQILLGHLKVRSEEPDGRLRLERLALADVVSLFPLSSIVRQPSWKAAFGWQRNRDPACGECVPFFLSAGLGAAGQWAGWRREVAYVFLDGAAEWDAALANGHRAGFGLSAGLLLDLAAAWRVGLTASRTAYTTGAAARVTRWALQQRVALGKDWEARLDWSGTEDYREALLAVGWFF